MSNKRVRYEAELKSKFKSFVELNNELEGIVLNWIPTQVGLVLGVVQARAVMS